MISAAGIKDQELTIIVSMMLIELALLRLSRFKRLALLDTQGLELWSRCIREFGCHSAMSAQCPVCPKADTARRFMRPRPATSAEYRFRSRDGAQAQPDSTAHCMARRDHHEDRTPTYGYPATREAAMAPFAKSWRRG
jgi:hypothetical protein